MTARVPRQQRAELRRDALVAAASKVIGRSGPSAFTARAVATAAGLPLAAVSYYFPSLDDLLSAAIGEVVGGWLADGEKGAKAAMSAEGVEPAVLAITAALLPGGSPEAIRLRYEHLLAAGTNPVTAAALAELRPRLASLIREILTGTGVRSAISADAIISLVDGAAIGATSEGDRTPRSRIEAALREVLGREHQGSDDQPIQSANDRPEIRS